MPDNPSQQPALEYYVKALNLFKAGRFAKAHQAINTYRHCVRYETFNHIDNRNIDGTIRASVIIVTRNRKKDLSECLHSLENQKGPLFEIIVVDNGSDDSLKDIASDNKILLIECPIPFTPSEGRNIGAFFSQSNLLIFLDDDAIADAGFVEAAVLAFEKYPFLGIRGKITPKSTETNSSLAGVYDMGDFPIPALLDVEGNIAVPSKIFKELEGMNPLLFGAEGLELTTRLIDQWPDGEVFYWPEMIIKHDYAAGSNLLAKRKRQALVNEYFKLLNPRVLRIKKHYARIYNEFCNRKHKLSLKMLPKKALNRLQNFRLTLNGEKTLSKFRSDPGSAPPMSLAQILPDSNSTEEKDAASLTNRIHHLESELERTRKSIDFKLGQLITEGFSSPFEQGLLLPIRLFRLIKDYKKTL